MPKKPKPRVSNRTVRLPPQIVIRLAQRSHSVNPYRLELHTDRRRDATGEHFIVRRLSKRFAHWVGICCYAVEMADKHQATIKDETKAPG